MQSDLLDQHNSKLHTFQFRKSTVSRCKRQNLGPWKTLPFAKSPFMRLMTHNLNFINYFSISIGNLDVDSDLDNLLHQNGLDSKSQNEPSEDQSILAGLQRIINERYLNSSKIFVHDSDHNHDHIKENEDTFEFEYICEIPFPNQVNHQNSTLIHVPEIPEFHDKLLDERIQNMLTAYRCNLYSYEKDSYSMSRPLKKRRIKY